MASCWSTSHSQSSIRFVLHLTKYGNNASSTSYISESFPYFLRHVCPAISSRRWPVQHRETHRAEHLVNKPIPLLPLHPVMGTDCYRYLFERSNSSLNRIFWPVGAVIMAHLRRHSRRFSPFSSHPENTGNSQATSTVESTPERLT